MDRMYSWGFGWLLLVKDVTCLLSGLNWGTMAAPMVQLPSNLYCKNYFKRPLKKTLSRHIFKRLGDVQVT